MKESVTIEVSPAWKMLGQAVLRQIERREKNDKYRQEQAAAGRRETARLAAEALADTKDAQA
jgi:hypothetical protein